MKCRETILVYFDLFHPESISKYHAVFVYVNGCPFLISYSNRYIIEVTRIASAGSESSHTHDPQSKIDPEADNTATTARSIPSVLYA